MNILKQLKSLSKGVYPFRFNAQSSVNTLDVDELASYYGVSVSKAGEFLQLQLGWKYNSYLGLSHFDVREEIDVVDKLQEFSAIILRSGTGEKRFITSNPDLILRDSQVRAGYVKSQFVFEIASRKELSKCLDILSLVKKILMEVEVGNRSAFALFLVSLLDSFRLGGHSIEYAKGGYSVQGDGERYEGVLSDNILSQVRSQLAVVGTEFLDEIAKHLGLRGEPVLEMFKGGFRVSLKDIMDISTSFPSVLPNDTLIPVSNQRASLKHLLLVDDDVRFAELLKRGIATKGYEVTVANSVSKAIELFASTEVKIDLVISDFHMPSDSGESLTAKIRVLDGSMPIIGLTADTQSASQIRFINAGVNAVVRKSDDPKVLFAWINKLLSNTPQLSIAS